MPRTPPIAKRIPARTRIHGDIVVDEYAWLRNRKDPDVLRHLRRENRYVESSLAHLRPLRDRLFREFRRRVRETDRSVPMRVGEFWYYVRTVRGKQYRIHCRRRGSLRAPEEVVLDENTLSRGRRYFELGVAEVSRDHALLAYTTDTSGAEEYMLFVKDMHSGQLRSDSITNIASDIVWASDQRTLYYLTLDPSKRPFQCWQHTTGTDRRADVLLYEEPDTRCSLRIRRSRSWRFLFLTSASKETTEVHTMDFLDPQARLRCIAPRRHGHRYDVEHAGDQFVIRTNDRALDFRIMSAPLRDPSQKQWRTIVPHQPGTRIEDIDGFSRFVAYEVMYDGIPEIRVFDFTINRGRTIAMPERLHDARLTWNPNFDTTTLRLQYASPVTPKTICEYDTQTRRLVVRKRETICGYHASRYRAQRITARASDGTSISITLTYRKGIRWDGRSPCLLIGYGAYGHSITPQFAPLHVSLLDRGVIIARAHVRGGGERGERWYRAGKYLQKSNTFTDFIACAQRLIRGRYTSAKHLAIEGRSAGGLLIGAVLNRRPDLFAAAVAGVPFVDVINTMRDASIPLTTSEYEEWGDPRVRRFYRAMRAYSPYENVRRQRYPALLVAAGLNDTRVGYWEPAKWVARLRERKLGAEPLYLRTNLGAGHGGPSGRYNHFREIAYECAFILDALGVHQRGDE
ncbi:MAG: S9 family peptidase [bacterium]|nr:S9 family peptidase [bacterium]